MGVGAGRPSSANPPPPPLTGGGSGVGIVFWNFGIIFQAYFWPLLVRSPPSNPKSLARKRRILAVMLPLWVGFGSLCWSWSEITDEKYGGSPQIDVDGASAKCSIIRGAP